MKNQKSSVVKIFIILFVLLIVIIPTVKIADSITRIQMYHLNGEKANSGISEQLTFEYNDRWYKYCGPISLFTFTKDKKIGNTSSDGEIYSVKLDNNHDFLLYFEWDNNALFTALDCDYDKMKAIADNGNITLYKIEREIDYEYFHSNDGAFLDALNTLDQNPDLLEPAGDYTKEDFGRMYRISFYYDNMPVSYCAFNQKGISVKDNQAYYLPNRYVADENDRTIYRVKDEKLSQILIEAINNCEFKEL